MKKNTFASVRVVEATPVKPKYPATTEMTKKMIAHLSMRFASLAPAPGARRVRAAPRAGPSGAWRPPSGAGAGP
jgi:hypothetical protein